MTARALALVALVSSAGVACVSSSQPQSPAAARDQALPLPPAATAQSSHDGDSAAKRRGARGRPVDLADVEIVPIAGSALGRARATVMVRAALERVRAVLVDFTNYPAFLPNYKSAKVVGTTTAGGSVVHMQIDALGGMIRRWMRIEVSPPTVTGTRESFVAKLLEGDVKAFEARWVLDRLDDGTRLTLESFIDADVPFPAAFIDAGSAAGLKESILAIKARAEDGAL
jgi:ribosome-associated toxin RatA of RatAB toxin-antitoxin module